MLVCLVFLLLFLFPICQQLLQAKLVLIRHGIDMESLGLTSNSQLLKKQKHKLAEQRESHVSVKMGGALWSKIQKALSKEIQREQLKHGDHIYTWTPDNSKTHGIYVGHKKVIHFTPRPAGQEYRVRCVHTDGFLGRGKLYRFEYGVNPVLFLAKPTCTLMCADTPRVVKHRACLLLKKGFCVHHVYKKGSEDFAVYCKTGLLSIRVRRSEQAASLLAISGAVFCLLVSIFTPASLTGLTAIAVVVYSTYRLASDIGTRPNISTHEVAVEGFTQVEAVKKLGFLPTLKAWIFLNFNFRRWVPYNKMRVDQLRPGDHIYTWRGYSYSHHGIYAGNGEVIHDVRGRGPYVYSSSPSSSSDNGACTLASSEPTSFVLHRANFLLKRGKQSRVILGAYDLFRNNCEDFAIYCKTGLAVRGSIPVGRSGQIACLLAAVGFVIAFKIPYPTSNLLRLSAGCFIYSTLRIISDTRFRKDTRRIPAERLVAGLQSATPVNV
ncbi:hypothetical protein FNV43_RR25530 [Rhamnella rubrinervis]|uniref:LRAT domain-containing protein n=1 Tax=Rhamnella rubrinervis TaxID=2594499 RepID=A0A8K0GM98_9ROSA|nr:hypothetical protein FNV43_RR25530 [Rhamnella rubrinervis]